MDTQDQSKTTIPSGHEIHGVHLCHRCGWPFPNPHPSARHRRAHKKICGTIEGYTNLIDSGVVSDDEHHPDEDKEKTPSRKSEKKKSIQESGGGIGGRSSRSEDDLFSDAVTEFSDSGTSPGVEDRSVGNPDSNKTLDRDLFFSFKDAENGGTNEVSDNPVEISKVDANLKISDTLDTHVEKIEETEVTTEAKLELPETDGKASDCLVKDEAVESTPGQSDVSKSHAAESIDVVEAAEDKVKETRTHEIDEHAVPTQEAKDAEVQASEMSKTTPESLVEAGVCVATGLPGGDDNGDHENLDKLSDVAVGEKLEAATADRNSDKIKHEKFESDHEHVSEVVKESEIDHSAEGITEEIKRAVCELDHEHAPEVLKEPEVDQSAEGISDEVKHEKFESDHEHAPEVVKESEIDQRAEGVGEEIKHGKLESDHEHASEAVKELETDQSVSVLTEKEDLGALKSEKCSKELTQEVVKEPDTILTEKADLGAPNLEKRPNEQTQEAVEEPNSVLTEKEALGAPNMEKCSKKPTQEVVKEPDTVLAENEDLGAPNLEKRPNEHTQEVVEEPSSVLTEKEALGAPKSEKCLKEHTQEVVEEPDSVLTEKEALVAPNSEKCSKEHAQEVTKEPKMNNDSNVVADVCAEKITLKEANQSANDLERASDSITNGKNASGVVSEPIVEEGNGKLMTNEDSGVNLSVDSSSHNSVEGNWGSVSVLSTASVDAESLHTIDKSKINSGKLVAADSHLGTSDVFEPPSFMTLVEPKGEAVDQKSAAATSSEVQASQQPKSEAPQAGWFPTLTNVSNESEGRKRNEEVIAKVTNWSTGKHSTPLKNLLVEAKSPHSNQPATVVQKDEAATEKPSLPSEAPVVNQDSSPPKLIDDGKKVRKKVKGRGSWVPFVCCSSVNVVN